ncbi:hypothetical protein NM688_g7675 [Phlebia brevispora]|uniref:Uncharacterized protein n=1 Tax=Phlebia brevispora TaxID=194682 RepID=A0ACC1S2C9_9APHY|nr:hypothetical protein NM688_g7675 [Phlebia brevispora]
MPNSAVVPEADVATAQGATLQQPNGESEAELPPPQRAYISAQGSPVSLPEEAKRYYSTMGDSPAPSPLTTHGFPHDSSGPQSPEKSTEGIDQQRADSPYKHAQRPQYDKRQDTFPNPYQEPPSQAEPIQDDSGIIDLDETDSAYDSVNDSGRASAVDSVEQEDYPEQQEGTIGKSSKKSAAVEDFPLPPTSPPIRPSMDTYNPGQLQQQQQQALQRIRNEPADSQVSLGGTTAAARSVADLNGSIPQSQSEASQLSSVSSSVPLSELAPQATFRALPLLSSDLPYTTIEVTNSSIRPNDRGKEVLSFVIARCAHGWTRASGASVGKTMGKKVATLPEGRLWKDHAPAKVDQRKATLEQYLRSLIALPVKNKDEIVAFFTTDILRSAQKPVAQVGYKEGYLTKRGKNFGGWKSRYFVLQGPSLEYYESRGGTHLGSILITGAQIGRQQRGLEKNNADEDNEYRHAFLIIEAKRGPTGSNARHVLCAESDAERDNWVEELVRYVSGTYNDDDLTVVQNGQVVQPGLARVSTSSTEVPSTPPRRPRKEDIAKGAAVPISRLAPDASNAKLFQSAPSLSDDSSITSPVKSAPTHPYVDQLIQSDAPMSSSLPASSPLAGDDSDVLAPVSQRANSEMGHYPDLVDARSSASKSKQGFVSPEQRRKDKRRSINPLKASPIPERTPSPEKDSVLQTPRVDAHGKVKISGPMNGTPIPAGYKFGGKDAPSEASSVSDRREKAKSRGFWGFGGAKHDKAVAPVHIPRAVFGVSLEESLDVAEIASLPAIVFRCIQYLEAKKAEQEEGIYRLSGSSAVIKSLKDRFNNEGDVDLLGSDEYWDPHAIAGLLKTYLRELPASILTRDLHLRFLSVIDFVDPQERVLELSQLIASLPTANYSLLRALTAHLILIVQNANINKMTMRNVGIVFSPTLGIPAGVFSLMLGEFKRVFNVDGALDDGQEGPEEVAENVEISRRNSKHYSDAAADQLLGLSGRTLSAPDDAQSDGEELSIHDDSGTEGTDNGEVESIVESSAASSTAYLTQGDLPQSADSDDNALSPGYRSKASNVAASRGLNISVADKASRRHSRMVGLPHSPRPAQDGVLFICLNVDYRVLFEPLTEDVIRDGMEFYKTFFYSPPAIKALMHAVMGMGILGLVGKIHKWDESAMFFDGSSLAAYVFAVSVYLSVGVPACRTVARPVEGVDTREDQIEALRVLSAGNTIIIVLLGAVLALQVGEEYARRAEAKEIARFAEQEKKTAPETSAATPGGTATENKKDQ